MGAYDPYEHAGELGVRVIHRKLTTGTGLWAPDINTVFIQERMHRVHERSALAHELGHVDLGHRDDRPKHEVAADRYAANNMVDPEHLVDLMRWSPDMSRWAHEMGVSTRLIRVYWNTHRHTLEFLTA